MEPCPFSTIFGGTVYAIKSSVHQAQENGSHVETLVFHSVPEDVADRIFTWLESRSRMKLSYYFEVRELIVYIPRVYHETASLCFASRIRNALGPWGVDQPIIPIGRATFRPANALGTKAGKQGDAGFKASTRTLANDVPNIVVETTSSHSYETAKQAAQYWLKTIGVRFQFQLPIDIPLTSLQVSVVIVIVVKLGTGDRDGYLRLERWQYIHKRRQVTLITDAIQTTEIWYNVVSDTSIILPPGDFEACTFKQLMDQDPQAGQPSAIKVRAADLHSLARAVFLSNQ